MSWTDEKVNKLKELWGKGHTASQIAQILGDTTRNAVIGKAHRLKLEARAPSKQISQNSNQTKQVRKTSQPLSRRARFQALLLDKNFQAEDPKSLEELSDKTCRWPIGHPNEKGFYFCGRTSLKDFSYCRLHLLYAFQPKNKKEEVVDKDSEVPKFIQKKIKSA